MPEIQKMIKQIVKLFCSLNGRDEFIESYSMLLAERLLKKLSVNDEAETSVIKGLQIECGLSVVSKLKTMFADMKKSAAIVSDFAM